MRRGLMVSSLLAVMAFTSLSGCGKTIEPGYTGIKINQMGSDKGVSKDSICTGWTFYVPSFQRIIKYPTFNQRVVWSQTVSEGTPTNEELTFNTADQMKVDMDASLNYTISPAKVPEFYLQYRADNIDTFTHGFLRDAARNAVTRIGGEYRFEDLNGVKKEEFLTRVEAAINAVVSPYGVMVRQFSAIGALRPPAEITRAVIAKTTATQNAITAENQLREIRANAEKKVAEAEGEARSNRAKAASITPVLLEQQRLDIERVKASKWNGVMPSTMLGAGANTLFSLK